MIALRQTTLTAVEAWREVEEREISLTGWRGLRLWVASAEIQTGKSKCSMRIVSHIGGSPLQAIAGLVAKLDAIATERNLLDEDQTQQYLD